LAEADPGNPGLTLVMASGSVAPTELVRDLYRPRTRGAGLH